MRSRPACRDRCKFCRRGDAQAYSRSYPIAHAYANTYWKCSAYCNTNGYCYRDCDSYCHRYGNIDAYGYPYCDHDIYTAAYSVTMGEPITRDSSDSGAEAMMAVISCPGSCRLPVAGAADV